MKKDYDSQLAANDFRRRHGLSETEAIRLKSLLMKLDVLAVFQPMSDAFSGMAVGQGGYRFMMVNNRHTTGRQHFTICHELYHLFVQADFHASICQTGLFQQQEDPVERKADAFAAHLLLPENGVLSLVPAPERDRDQMTLRTILRIEQYYTCSRSALLHRLQELGLLSKTYAQVFQENVQAQARAHGYSLGLYRPTPRAGLEVIGDYGDIARQLYDGDHISESHYLSLMQDIGVEEEEIQPESEQAHATG